MVAVRITLSFCLVGWLMAVTLSWKTAKIADEKSVRAPCVRGDERARRIAIFRQFCNPAVLAISLWGGPKEDTVV